MTAIITMDGRGSLNFHVCRKGAMWSSIMPQVARLLPCSSFAGEPPAFEIDHQGWKEIEALVGPISPGTRDEVIKAIRTYLWTASIALSAGNLDEAAKVATRFQTDLARVRKAMSMSSTSDAQDLVSVLFARNLHHPLILDDLSPEIKIEIFANLLQAGETACAQTIDELAGDKHAGPPIGRYWEGLMRRLTSIFDRNGLSTGVRKDDDVTEQQSPFVYVIDLLQSQFDPQYCRATQSLSALSVAISKARRVPKT
jgi:hypothetical protein